MRFYGSDLHHDISWTADAAGAVSATLRYDPYGTLVDHSGTSLPDFRFQGSLYDSSVDLAWVVTRWYAPALATFISEDSLLGTPADPPSRHLNAYAQGDPLDGWDPSGQFWYRVRLGNSLWKIAMKTYGAARTSWITRGNPGRVTPRNLAKQGLHTGDCIWIPYRNQRSTCLPNLARGVFYSPYASGLYERYNATLDFIFKRMVTDRAENAGDVGTWQSCPIFFQWCLPFNIAVLGAFAAQVHGGGHWDYKGPLARAIGNRKGYWTAVPGDPAPEALYYDVWTNIHYGCVGRAHGIPSDVLHAGAEQLGGVRTVSDWISNEIGIGLWDRFGTRLTKRELGDAVFTELHAYRNDPAFRWLEVRPGLPQ